MTCWPCEGGFSPEQMLWVVQRFAPPQEQRRPVSQAGVATDTGSGGGDRLSPAVGFFHAFAIERNRDGENRSGLGSVDGVGPDAERDSDLVERHS